ncbi:MAG TPA: FAD-dependent oxidoreductase [Trebonia sp.]
MAKKPDCNRAGLSLGGTIIVDATGDLDLSAQAGGAFVADAGTDGTVELESRRRTTSHLDFFRKEAPGFENAWIMLAAPRIGVRMTRRLAGVYPMTSQDWKAGVRHPDEVGVSPPPSQKFATISVPYRALLPERLDGAAATWPATPPPRPSCARSRSAG